MNATEKFYLKRNIWTIYIFNFFKGLIFFLPIYTLYLQQELFTAFNVTLIISIQAIGRILFEVPTGAIADLFGRKNTLIISAVVGIIALIFLGIGGSLMFFIIFAILNALSEGLQSGTDTAILFDSLKLIDKKTNFQKVVTWDIGAWQVGAIVSAIVGGTLASISLKLPVILTIIPWIISLLILFWLKEPKYDKESHRDILRQMRDSTKVIMHDTQLKIIFITSILIFSFSEIAYQLNPLLFTYKNIPIEYFGVISAVIFALAFLGSIITSHWLTTKFKDKTILIVSAIISPIILFSAAMTTGLWTAILIALGSLSWSVRLPIITDLTNRNIQSKHRATVLSIGSLFNILGLAILAPIFGLITDANTVAYTFKICALLSLTAIIPLMFIKGRKIK
jgi:MFS family permease